MPNGDSMMKMDSDAASLLVGYAVGCAEELVKEKKMDSLFADDLRRRVFESRPLTEEDAQKFTVAYVKCSSLARRLGKKSIDTETVRAYFFKPSEHDRFVDDSFDADRTLNIGWDFAPSDCKAQEGRVVKVKKDSVLVNAMMEGREIEKEVKNPIHNLKAGAYVVFHRGYVAEELNAELRALIKSLRESDTRNVEMLRGAFKRGETKIRVRS